MASVMQETIRAVRNAMANLLKADEGLPVFDARTL